MIKSLTTALLIIVTLSVFGEGPANIGIKFGTNTSTMFTNFDDVLNQSILEEDVNNYLAGAFIRLNLGRIYFQPEAYFNTKGGIIRSNTGIEQTNVESPYTVFDYQTLDVPVLLGVKLINGKLINLRIHCGPVFSYVTANSFVTDISDFNEADLNDRFMGWQIGAGIDVWFLSVDARIENNNQLLSNTSSYSVRNRVYLLSAAIKLF